MSRLILVVLGVLCSAGAAFAQMIDTPDAVVTVTAEHAEVRCGWGSDGWYAVGRVPRGASLVTDGREGDWLRVRYPDGQGFGVLLRGDDVTVDQAAGTATLNKPARPIFMNRTDPLSGSWMKMTGDPFPAGRVFEVVETIGGDVAMVLVTAPDRVRGYVLASDVSAGAPAQPSDQAPADEAPADDAAVDADNAAAGAGEPATETPAEAPAETPADTAAGENNDDNEPEARSPLTPAELMLAYDAVVREPAADAELEPLLDEFRFTLAQGGLDAQDSARLRSRLELLEIRRDLQSDLRAVVTASERASRERDAIDRLVVDWQSRPEYAAVGRLMASALYDGRRLPLMYRLQSLDGLGGRTIAYILPDDALDLNAKLGAVVGVVGEPRRDRTIRVRLIDPTAVDVLEAGG